MKKVLTTAIIIICTFMIGKAYGRIGHINTESEEFYNNYIDMREVVDFEASESGLYIYLENGEGYYRER